MIERSPMLSVKDGLESAIYRTRSRTRMAMPPCSNAVLLIDLTGGGTHADK